MRLEEVQEPSGDWDEYVRRVPHGTFCHLAGWRGVMEEVLGHKTMYAVVRNGDGAMDGVLPLVAVESRVFGRHLVSMPFMNYGGAAGSPRARQMLSQWALEQAQCQGVDVLELRQRAANADAPLPTDMAVNQRKVTVLLPLPSDPQVLWREGLRGKVRSQVRRPMKAGMEVRFGPGEVGPFYEVFVRNMRELGTPVLPLRLFAELPVRFPDEVRFACVYLNGEPVAGGCGFLFSREFEITWASALREHSRMAPNMLLYWSMLERAIQEGADTFNFGRCTPGGGTHRFKLQWGGQDEPLPWAVWGSRGAGQTPSPDQARFRWATQVWRRLPLSVTRVVGPPLARLLP